ncbi:hypothetical protein KBA27_05780, partial [bacterium]|nr:hypothetical protein [bacterium]
LNHELELLNKCMNSFDYSATEKAKLGKYIQTITTSINNDKKGEMEEILGIYKTLSPKNYTGVKKSADKATKALQKATDIEENKLFDKVRDFKVGIVAADMVTVGTSLGIVGSGLITADNNDERASVSLRYGIPVLGAVTTSLLCTAKLISGPKAIVLGLGSGEVIHKIGNYVDEKRKEVNTGAKTQPPQTNNAPITTGQQTKAKAQSTTTPPVQKNDSTEVVKKEDKTTN